MAKAELGMHPGAPGRCSVHNCISEWLQLRHTAPEHGLKVPDPQLLPFPSLFASEDLGKPAAMEGTGSFIWNSWAQRLAPSGPPGACRGAAPGTPSGGGSSRHAHSLAISPSPLPGWQAKGGT